MVPHEPGGKWRLLPVTMKSTPCGFSARQKLFVPWIWQTGIERLWIVDLLALAS